MGAHDIPKEYKSRKGAYISLLIDKIIPEVRRRKLAEFFDVFCEEGVYSVEETRRLVEAAKRAGFKIRIHADEFAALGGAELAAEVGAASADHLISITEEGIRALSRSETAATLLPGCVLLPDARQTGAGHDSSSMPAPPLTWPRISTPGARWSARCSSCCSSASIF